MFFIPGIVISVATFPGVIVHELAHLLFCKSRKVPVLDVRFFAFDMNTAGYVIHADPDDYLSTFLISIGPLFLNTLLCLLICIPASTPFFMFEDKSLLNYFLLWLGVSIGMHSFPSNEDANNLWEKAKRKGEKTNVFKIITMPIVVLVFIANLLRVIWFDAMYGFFIGVLVPQFILNHLF